MTWTVILDELTNYLVIFFCFIRPDWILFDIWLSNIVKSRDNIIRYRLTRIGNESINQFETLKIPVRWIMRSAEYGVRSVENAECGKCGVWKMQSVENEECGKCGVWKMRSVENAECGKWGVWKMRSVENAECVLLIFNSFVFSLLIISLHMRLKIINRIALSLHFHG